MGGGGTQTASTSSSQAQTPEAWMDNLSQQIGQAGAAGFGQSNYLANQIQGGATGMTNAGNAMTKQAGTLAGNAYNQANTASQYDPNTFQKNFMNPYTQDVVNQNAMIAQRDFNQQTAPSLMGQMGASGQFGSGRAQQAMALANTQNQQNVNQINAQLMNQGYNQAQQNYLNSMGIGVQGANAMNSAAGTIAGAGNQAFNQGLSQLMAPVGMFGGYAASLHQLPYGVNTNSAGTQNQPSQSLF